MPEHTFFYKITFKFNLDIVAIFETLLAHYMFDAYFADIFKILLLQYCLNTALTLQIVINK